MWQASGRVDRRTLRKLPSDLDCTPVCRPLDTNKHKIEVQTQPHTQTQTITQQRWARTKYITNTVFMFQDCFHFLWPGHNTLLLLPLGRGTTSCCSFFSGEIGSKHFYNSWSYLGVGLNIYVFFLWRCLIIFEYLKPYCS